MPIVLDKQKSFKRFSMKCTQGIVGTCNLGFWKVPKKAGFTCEAEYCTGRAIMDSHLSILPHFVKVLKCENVFLSSDDKLERSCLFMENIKGGRFVDVIDNCGESNDVMSVIKQTLISTAAAQDILEYTHYDLHIENIIVKETSVDVYVYIFPDGKIYPVKTFGLCAVTIDYGYSYTNKSESILPSLYHNEAGFQPYHFSPLSDVMTLLCSVTYEFAPESKLTKEVVKMFKGMRSLDWKCGWFTGFTNFPKDIVRLFRPPIVEVRKNSIFHDVPLVADIIQALIKLPLTQPTQPENSYKKTFSTLYYHWFLIEETLSNPEAESWLLKTIVGAMRESKSPKDEVEKIFKREFEVDYDVIAKCLEEMALRLWHVVKRMEKRDTERRDKMYSNLGISSALDAFNALNKTRPTYAGADKLRFFDLRNGKTYTTVLSKHQAKRLNNGTQSIENMALEFYEN